MLSRTMNTTPYRFLLIAGALVSSLVTCSAADNVPPIGYTDTPFLPGGKWRVHDINRPRPQAVQPSPFKSEAPPTDAIVLFDGKDLAQWVDKDGKSAPWKIVDGCLEVVPKSGDIYTKQKFGSFKLHLEWREPADITGSSQMRGNSGVFLASRYEIQVLDCYNNLMVRPRRWSILAFRRANGKPMTSLLKLRSLRRARLKSQPM